MMNTKILIGIVAVFVIAGGAFYGGFVYAAGKPMKGGQITNGQYGGQPGGAGAMRACGMRGGAGGFMAGQVLSKDAAGVTIKMPDGSTKIVLVGPSTEVMKAVPGTAGDLTVGTSVTISGTPNSDGSITAQSVQIRPAGAPLPPIQRGGAVQQ